MEKQKYLKSKGGGQFFQLLSETEVKVISLYEFNPIIERRRISSTIITELKCVPCPKEEFEAAQQTAMELLDLPVPFLVSAVVEHV
ncbi:hypothetical protein [Runella sp.]|uniref:hypothetical protein n=1 Tax=Runella sp. TaxID=1960881 RepID=UPI003D0C8013